MANPGPFNLNQKLNQSKMDILQGMKKLMRDPSVGTDQKTIKASEESDSPAVSASPSQVGPKFWQAPAPLPSTSTPQVSAPQKEQGSDLFGALKNFRNSIRMPNQKPAIEGPPDKDLVIVKQEVVDTKPRPDKRSDENFVTRDQQDDAQMMQEAIEMEKMRLQELENMKMEGVEEDELRSMYGDEMADYYSMDGAKELMEPSSGNLSLLSASSANVINLTQKQQEELLDEKKKPKGVLDWLKEGFAQHKKQREYRTGVAFAPFHLRHQSSRVQYYGGVPVLNFLMFLRKIVLDWENKALSLLCLFGFLFCWYFELLIAGALFCAMLAILWPRIDPFPPPGTWEADVRAKKARATLPEPNTTQLNTVWKDVRADLFYEPRPTIPEDMYMASQKMKIMADSFILLRNQLDWTNPAVTWLIVGCLGTASFVFATLPMIPIMLIMIRYGILVLVLEAFIIQAYYINHPHLEPRFTFKALTLQAIGILQAKAEEFQQHPDISGAFFLPSAYTSRM